MSSCCMLPTDLDVAFSCHHEDSCPRAYYPGSSGASFPLKQGELLSGCRWAGQISESTWRAAQGYPVPPATSTLSQVAGVGESWEQKKQGRSGLLTWGRWEPTVIRATGTMGCSSQEGMPVRRGRAMARSSVTEMH